MNAGENILSLVNNFPNEGFSMSDMYRMLPPAAIDHSRMNDLMKRPLMPSKLETEARLYVEGLEALARELAKTLQPDQELVVYCLHGNEELRVTTITMPSHTVVAIQCIDQDRATVHIAGHMNALRFSFRVRTVVPPAVKQSIGFNMTTPESV